MGFLRRYLKLGIHKPATQHLKHHRWPAFNPNGSANLFKNAWLLEDEMGLFLVEENNTDVWLLEDSD